MWTEWIIFFSFILCSLYWETVHLLCVRVWERFWATQRSGMWRVSTPLSPHCCFTSPHTHKISCTTTELSKELDNSTLNWWVQTNKQTIDFFWPKSFHQHYTSLSFNFCDYAFFSLNTHHEQIRTKMLNECYSYN
jgi:hypothetical protein